MGTEEKRTGACTVVTRDLRRPQLCKQWSVQSTPRRINAYYPDFAYRIDVKRKSLQVLSVVGPAKYVEGVGIESASCFNRLRAEGDALCIEEYGKRHGFVLNTNTTSTFFTAIFECLYGEEVKWVNEMPFDAGATELVMSLARQASSWIQFFQRNISKLTPHGRPPNPSHTRLSLVLQLDVINCESWVARMPKQPFDVRFGVDLSKVKTQGAAKKQKGVRYRHDRGKWVAEYNPPGKKNNKISLGEYDNEVEAGRAADAGMYCYNSKRPSYNFVDSPSLLQPYLQQAPQPVNEDKEAVRKWARDFAKLTTKGSFNSSTSSSFSIDTPASPSCLTFPDEVNMGVTSPTSMIEQFDIPSPASLSTIADFSRVSDALEFAPSIEFDSDSSSGGSLHLEDVTEYFSSRDMSVMDDFNPDFNPGPTQINSNPPPLEQMGFSEDVLYRNDIDNLWGSASPQNPLIRTASDGRSVSDELFQCLMAWNNPANNSEVERCSIQLIR
ncbi:hypothetical protein M758_10G084900 [Ceratodon purpureus]|uniref:AP2/ERF domain-containing protein n=1 Tax=Ceratodon purpureus TaxID=3225 RepID=A0A8T0GJM3_CERPU|nr:hypothetical protein KC19_10G086400 [Ceratodon purpureus]KAG0603325.1 hypothetical protein M758_10G084900 [Ceratodon purpureus]